MRGAPCRVHGFTLVELLVTMGLMAMLATVSIAGYYGAVRGMTERGVKQDIISFVRLAQQRALVDQVPTAVFLMNRYLRAENQELGEARRVVGMAVAVRMAGRISYAKGKYLADEYADLDKTYSTRKSSGSGGSTMRLWRMVKNDNVDQCYSTVFDTVERVKLLTEDMLMNPEHPQTNDVPVWAFVKEGGHDAPWRVGDPYGTEIASLQLPHGYMFDNASVSRVGETKGVKAFFFYPDAENIKNKVEAVGDSFDFSGISIVANRPGGTTKKIGTISKSDLRDNKQDNN